MARWFYTFGLFILGISSLGFIPTSADPWIKPKIILSLVGLFFLVFTSVINLKTLPDLRKVSTIGLPLLLFSFFLLFQCFYFHYSFTQLFFLFPLCFFSGLAFIFRDDFEIKNISGWLSLVFVIQSIVAIAQFLFFEHFGFQMMGHALKWRTLGLIGNPNQLALFLSLYFFLPGAYFWNSQWNKVKSSLVIFALALTFSRGVFLALFLIGFIEFKPEQRKRIFFPIFAIILLMIFVEYFIGTTGLLNSDSLTGRWKSYNVFFKELNLQPEALILGRRTWDLASPVHNQFLFLLNNFGLIGVSLFCWFIFSLYRRARKPALMFFLFSIYDLPLLNAAFVTMLLLLILLISEHSVNSARPINQD